MDGLKQNSWYDNPKAMTREETLMRIRQDAIEYAYDDILTTCSFDYLNGTKSERNKTIDEVIIFCKDWWGNERALEGLDFYDELQKMKV